MIVFLNFSVDILYVTEKVCKLCGELKGLDEYFINRRICKSCVRYKIRQKVKRKFKQMKNIDGIIIPNSEVQRIRIKVLISLGAKCVGFEKVCNVTDTDVLDIDHIAGNGRKERKRFGCNYYMYKYILRLSMINRKRKYQILCANCNRKKEIIRRRNNILL